MTAWPVRTPPVKETMSTPGWPTSAAPSAASGPLTTLRTPGGRISAIAAATSKTVAGHVGGALTTTVSPARRAGRILLAMTETGQLKGRIAATTPWGTHSTRVAPPLSSRAASASATTRREGGGHAAHGGGVEDGLEVGLAVLTGEQAGQVVGLHERHARLGGCHDRRRPLVHGQRGPGGLRPAGRRHGLVELGRRGRRGLEHDLGGAGRVGHRVGALAAGHDVAVDQEADAGRDVLDVCGHAHPLGRPTLLTIVSPSHGSRRDSTRAERGPAHRATLLPDPEPRAVRVPVISVDDHLIEPPDLFEGRLPAALQERRAQRGRGGRRVAGLDLRGQPLPQRRPQRRRRAAARRVEHGPGPLRRDAPGLLRHRGPHRGHGPGRPVGLAVLPLARLGLLRRRLLAGAGQGPRPGLPARLQRLAPRHVGRHYAPERIIPLQLPWLADVDRRGCRGPGQRGAGLQGGELPRVPRAAGSAVHLQRGVGPLLRRLRGDRHRRLPAHRRVGLGAARVLRPALRDPPHLLPRQRAARRRRVAVVGRAAALPEAERRACPRAASAG